MGQSVPKEEPGVPYNVTLKELNVKECTIGDVIVLVTDYLDIGDIITGLDVLADGTSLYNYDMDLPFRNLALTNGSLLVVRKFDSPLKEADANRYLSMYLIKRVLSHSRR